MKNALNLAVIAATMVSASAFAADLPSKKGAATAPVVVSPWDFNVGAGITTDYISRGITASGHYPSFNANAELNYTFSDMFQAYQGVSAESLRNASATMELDTYTGLRSTFGKFAIDTGLQGYIYPGATSTPSQASPDYYELYAVPTFAVTDAFTIGAKYYYAPNYVGMGTRGQYIAATAKYALPMGVTLSGEFGRELQGSQSKTGSYYSTYNGSLIDYNAYNIGASYAYKFVTLDLRYYGTNVSSSTDCLHAGGGGGNACDQRVVGTLSFAFTSKDIK